jgi:DNA primase
MSNPGDFAYTVKQQADIVRIIGDYIKLKKAGSQNFSGLCPFHGEKTASFSVHATRQFYHCFGCGVSGDVFSFVQKIENITFPEAVRLVAQKLGIAVPKASYATAGEAKEAHLRGQLLDAHERAVSFFQECLCRPEGANAREYLKGRGLDDSTIAKFRIGYAPDSGFLLRDRLKNDFPEDVLRESGLFSWKQEESPKQAGTKQRGAGVAPPLSRSLRQGGDVDSQKQEETTKQGGAPFKPGSGLSGEVDSSHSRVSSRAEHQFRESGIDAQSRDLVSSSQLGTRNSVLALYSKFRNRVMFPIANESGKVIAFTGRTLSTDEKAGPKYLNSPETPIYSKGKVLFNLDLAKEAIRVLKYAILVEGQMDCISVYAAGFHNVIASSGTAFTELQAKLLGRFSKNVVVNFDPDTAGDKAASQLIGPLVEEGFDVKVMDLDQGFDPDLYIRQKGRETYDQEIKAQRENIADTLRQSPKYFDYLIERARRQFPVRSADGKVNALNYLLPHIQRIPNRIARDEIANEIAQKLAIDSAVLRQELRHAAATRSTSAVKAPAEAQVTDAEKILIRALTSARQMQMGEEHLSMRDGAEEGFDPARQATFVLQTESLHRGLATESLVESLLNSAPEVADVLEVPATESDRRLLASILLKEEEELTAEIVEAAAHALRRIHLRRQLEEVQRKLRALGATADLKEKIALSAEAQRISLALRDPGQSAEIKAAS